MTAKIEQINLKSNMDRFIVLMIIILHLTILNLKSNMDRFIGNAVKGIPDAILEFKIQYG